jgi:hypothetical protein
LQAVLTGQEESLHKIINSMNGKITLKNGMTISKAFSGDDLYIIIKNATGNNIDLIGADARGLGITNMMTRLNELVTPGTKTNSIDDVISN